MDWMVDMVDMVEKWRRKTSDLLLVQLLFVRLSLLPTCFRFLEVLFLLFLT